MVRVNERDDSTSWSNAFAIDAVGNNGTVSSKSINNNGKLYEFGIDIKLQKSSNGLTKIIKLTPYYLLINQTNVFKFNFFNLGFNQLILSHYLIYDK